MDITSTIEEKVHLRLTPTTASGQPATVDGKPTWTIEEGNATLEVDEDGLGAWLISADEVGESAYKVSADADLGEGVKNIEVIGKYTYTNAQAANLGLVAEPAVPK